MKEIPFFSLENRFEFGYNKKPFILRKSLSDQYYVKLAPCTREPLSFKDECLSAAHEITKAAGQTPTILLSGGMDSEIVAESFRLQNLPFRPVIFKYKNDLNKHDVDFALDYVRRHQLEHEIFDFDVMAFYETEEIQNLARVLYCPYPMLLTQVKMLDILSSAGHFIIGGCSDPRYRYLNGTWTYYTEEYGESLKRFQLIKRFKSQISFFLWRSEIFCSHARDPYTEKMFQLRDPQKTWSYDYKFNFYLSHFSLRERPKYTGYEKFVDYHRRKTQQLTLELGHPYDQFYFWSRKSVLNLWPR
jgi:hypothetical protein